MSDDYILALTPEEALELREHLDDVFAATGPDDTVPYGLISISLKIDYIERKARANHEM